MNYLLSFVFAVAGIACFVWYKTLYRALAAFFAKRFHEEFGQLATTMRWDNPKDRWNLIIYQTGIFFLGVFLLAMAFHFAVGTIYTGSARSSNVGTSSMLYQQN